MRQLRSSAKAIVLSAILILLAVLAGSQPSPREQVGPLPGGGFLLNSGWRVAPAGKQVPLDTLPMSTALSPDGKYLLVLNGGYRPPSISVIDTASAAVVSRISVPDAWLGLTFTPAGDRVYVGGGSKGAVFEFTFANGTLTAARTFTVFAEGRLAEQDFVGDVAFDPAGRLLYVAQLYRDSVAIVNPLSGMTTGRYKTGRRPYRILFPPDGKTFFVTHWADGTMGQYETASGSRVDLVRIGQHPTDMVWRKGGPEEPAPGQPNFVARLFVAASNTNNVYSVGVSEGGELNIIESINVSFTPRQPLGMTPSALALSPDGNRLYVACSDANAAAVVNVSDTRSRVEGFVPTGWYPTAVRVLPAGQLVVLNGKGLRSYPNPAGPSPFRAAEPEHQGVPVVEYVGAMQSGTASWIEPFTDEQLASWTHEVIGNAAYSDARMDEPNPLPPIQHVIYIVRESPTYDQVLGDMKEGDGDPSLVLFGEKVTPNLHKLAREFVLLDNFYVNADVSADGLNWSTAAIAPDYVQKLWPNNYANRRKTADFEAQDPASLPPAGYLWTNASSAGITLRNFGHMVSNRPIAPFGAEQITAVRDSVLAKNTNRLYRGFDLDYPDVDRVKVFRAELTDYEKSGAMPRLIVMRLGNDHTSGTAPGRIAPLSSAADNDLALGTLVEAVSKSKFWTSTAIFVLESDAQNGSDHVDSHRSPAFVISPFSKRHAVDGTMYNTASMLRTIEYLLGLRPMTHFDAGARPMTAVFQPTPDPAGYTAEKATIPLDAKNPATAPGAAIREDAPLPVRSYLGK